VAINTITITFSIATTTSDITTREQVQEVRK
jgi:hypothetical protein